MNDGLRFGERADAAYLVGLAKLVELLEEMPDADSVSKTPDQEQYVRGLIKAIRTKDPTVLSFRKPRLRIHAFLSDSHPEDVDFAMERINHLFD